jgi:glycosyltransferase involved in cell wall biosynthesis
MARMLIRALQEAGYDVCVSSRLRSYSSDPSEQVRLGLERQAADEARSLLVSLGTKRPDLWFTYHPYYKAPDWIGPAVSGQLGIPYVTAEASYAGKRDADSWRAWQAPVVAALKSAAVNFCYTPIDRAGLERIPDRRGVLVDLPPFIDRPPALPRQGPDREPGIVSLIAVAMMRAGYKVRSYRFLAEALEGLCELPWRLTIVGDGPAKAEVVAAFSRLPAERLIWTGKLAQDQIESHLAASDIHVWPGFEEAYGMAYLEAQSEGLPVVALNTDGVPSVVVDGKTGLLTEPDNVAAYRDALRTLMLDHGLRRRMGAAAARFVREERTLARAAAILRGALDPLRGMTGEAR